MQSVNFHEILDCEVSVKLVNKFQLKLNDNEQILYTNTYTHYPAHFVCNLPNIPETMEHI
jgi:hypothetical protein